MNFGGYATPERNLVFDINDFDETFPGPWEWDIKRLGASLVLAARDRSFSKQVAKDAVRAAVASYRDDCRYVVDVTMSRCSAFTLHPLAMNCVASQSSNSG